MNDDWRDKRSTIGSTFSFLTTDVEDGTTGVASERNNGRQKDGRRSDESARHVSAHLPPQLGHQGASLRAARVGGRARRLGAGDPERQLLVAEVDVDGRLIDVAPVAVDVAQGKRQTVVLIALVSTSSILLMDLLIGTVVSIVPCLREQKTIVPRNMVWR